MKKLFTLSLVVLLLTGLLAGCSGKSEASDGFVGSADNGMGAISDSVTEESLSKPAEGTSTNPTPQNQKLIRKIWINAETEDLDSLLAQVDQRITELSGYVEEREVYHGSANTSRRYRYANLTIRVPASQLNAFVDQVSQVSNITSTNETADDITLSYIATQSRITALETEQARLLELLAQAETMEDLLKIESRLTDVRTELEEVTSQLRLYDNLVDYGTIYLNLSEVREYTVVEEPETVWERIGTGFMESLKNLGTFFTELFVFVIVALPYLAIIAVLAAGIVLLIKFRKHKPKKTSSPQQEQE